MTKVPCHIIVGASGIGSVIFSILACKMKMKIVSVTETLRKVHKVMILKHLANFK